MLQITMFRVECEGMFTLSRGRRWSNLTRNECCVDGCNMQASLCAFAKLYCYEIRMFITATMALARYMHRQGARRRLIVAPNLIECAVTWRDWLGRRAAGRGIVYTRVVQAGTVACVPHCSAQPRALTFFFFFLAPPSGSGFLPCW